MTTNETVWVTQEALDSLVAELENLKTVVRPSINEQVAAARDEGDLKENGGYPAAGEEQGKTEAGLSPLEEILRGAVGGGNPADDGLVEVGMKVTIQFEGDDDTQTFLLGSRELLSMDSNVELEVYSPTSPLGTALLGKSAGDSASYEAPNGRTINVKIVDAKPF